MKKFINLICILILCVITTACGSAENASSTSQETASAESLAASGAAESESEISPSEESSAVVYPLTVTDQLGRSVTLEQKPETLVSSYYISTSALISLGLSDKLIGVEDKAGKRPIYGLSAPFILELPAIGTAKELNLETVASLKPDLAVLPSKVKGMAEAVEALGIPVIFVNPESRTDLVAMIRLLASATDTVDAGEALISYIESSLNDLDRRLEGKEKPRVYFAGNSSMLSTAGGAMYQSDMLCSAGAVNVAEDIEDTYWFITDYEQVLAWDPEIIVMASDASYSIDDVLNDPALAGCRAVIDGKVYKLPSDAESWDSPVPGGFLGSIWLASQLHPDVISTEESNEIIRQYYETFYNFIYEAK